MVSEVELRGPGFLVVGSAHVDVFADVDPRETPSDHVDKRGTFHVGLGGTACNVAVGLCSLGAQVTLISALPQNSIFSYVVKHVLRRIRNLHLVVEHLEDQVDAGFIAIRQNGDLFFAVSSTPLERHHVDPTLYERRIRSSQAVVLDTNNSLRTIRDFLSAATREGKRTFLLATSEIKALKILHLGDLVPEGIFLNSREYAFLRRNAQFEPCEAIGSTWFITSPDGVTVCYRGRKEFFPAPEISEARSYSGCGDAFAAGCMFGLVDRSARLEVVINSAYLLTELVARSTTAQALTEKVLTVDSIYRDALTGLYTRKFLEDEKAFIQGMIQRYGGMHSGIVSVLMLDVDRFKSINDTWGHKTGDRVLRHIGSIVANNLRKTDVAVRYGGEEITVILPGCPLEKAVEIAEHLRETIESHPTPAGGSKLRVTVSIGVAEGTDLDSTIERADRALYEAKQTGRNRVCADRTPVELSLFNVENA